MWTLDPCKGYTQQTAMWRSSKSFGKILAIYLLWQSFLRQILCACNSANCILLCAQFEVKHKHVLYQLWNSKNRTSSTLGGTFCKSQVQIVTSRGGGQIKYYHRQFAGFKIISPPLYTHLLNFVIAHFIMHIVHRYWTDLDLSIGTLRFIDMGVRICVIYFWIVIALWNIL